MNPFMPAQICVLLIALVPGCMAADAVDPGPATFSDLQSALGPEIAVTLGRTLVFPRFIGKLSLEDNQTFTVARYDTPDLAKLALTTPSPRGDSIRYIRGCWTFELGDLDKGARAAIVKKLGLNPEEKPVPPPVLTDPEILTSRFLQRNLIPAEAQYRDSTFTDQDENETGEFGLFPEMSGMFKVGKDKLLTLNLVPAEFDSVEPVVFGYRFKIYLPAGPTTALTSGADGTRPILNARTDKEAIALQEQHWVCYAWPVSGHGMEFAVNETGNLYRRPYPDVPPIWNDLHDGTWKDADAALKPGWVIVPVVRLGSDDPTGKPKWEPIIPP